MAHLGIVEKEQELCVFFKIHTHTHTHTHTRLYISLYFGVTKRSNSTARTLSTLQRHNYHANNNTHTHIPTHTHIRVCALADASAHTGGCAHARTCLCGTHTWTIKGVPPIFCIPCFLVLQDWHSFSSFIDVWFLIDLIMFLMKKLSSSQRKTLCMNFFF